MTKKYVIFGATGSIGSTLAEQLYKEKADCHLVAKNENEVKKLATKLNYSYSVCDVLELDFVNKLSQDLISTEILNNDEIKWIDTYHENVYKNLSEFMQEKELVWLKKSCGPILQ